MMWPPESVKMHSTPSPLRARAASLPPCRGLGSGMRDPSRAPVGAQRRYHQSAEPVKPEPEPEPEPEPLPIDSARLRSEEHTSELQSRLHLVCRLLLEKK